MRFILKILGFDQIRKIRKHDPKILPSAVNRAGRFLRRLGFVVDNPERVTCGLGNSRIFVIGEAPDLRLNGGIPYGTEHGEHGRNVFTPVESLLEEWLGFSSALNQHHSGDCANLFVVRSQRANKRPAGGANTHDPPDQ